MKWRIHHAARTGSTNADARAGKAGDVFVADAQTAGRGRLAHDWFSPPGLNLYFSAVLPVGTLGPAEAATLPLVVGLAVCESAGRLLAPFPDAPRCGLKWPNDVLADGKKLCGILCERHGDNVIAGIGLNVNVREAPPALAARMTSLSLAAGSHHDFDRAVVLSAVLEAVGCLHQTWLAAGFASLAPRIAPYDLLKGRTVSILQTDTDDNPVKGLCGGIQSDGTLLVGSTPIFAGEAHLLSI